MSDTQEDVDDFEFSESELSLPENLDTKDLMDSFKTLGKYSSSKLASGFSENDHQEKLEQLIGSLGNFYPIPVLEMAVKFYRAKQRMVAQKLMEVMFEEGATKISFGKDEEWVKDYELNIKIEDKTAFYGWLEEKGYGNLIKTEFKFDKSVEKDRIKAFVQYLLENKVPFDKDENIHPMTLKSNMRKIYELGIINEEETQGIFKVIPQNVLKFKIKK